MEEHLDVLAWDGPASPLNVCFLPEQILDYPGDVPLKVLREGRCGRVDISGFQESEAVDDELRNLFRRFLRPREDIDIGLQGLKEGPVYQRYIFGILDHIGILFHLFLIAFINQIHRQQLLQFSVSLK